MKTLLVSILMAVSLAQAESYRFEVVKKYPDQHKRSIQTIECNQACISSTATKDKISFLKKDMEETLPSSFLQEVKALKPSSHSSPWLTVLIQTPLINERLSIYPTVTYPPEARSTLQEQGHLEQEWNIMFMKEFRK